MENVRASALQPLQPWQFPFSAKIVIALFAIGVLTYAVAASGPDVSEEVALSGEYLFPAP